jgi:beta-lactamase superfamily II metal-dependent hydrolase
LGLPTPEQVAAAPFSLVVFGMGLGESILVRVEEADGAKWAVIDSARRVHNKVAINPALDTLVACDAHPDLVVLTHPHLDHTKGMADIVRRAAHGAIVACIEQLMEPADDLEALAEADDRLATDVAQSVATHAAMQQAWRKGIARRWPLEQEADPIMLGQWRIGILHPARAEIEAVAAEIAAGGDPNLNNVSAAFVVERGDTRLVLGADGEHAAWEAVQSRIDPDNLRKARPLKVPHHASRAAQHPVLTDAADPHAGREQVATPFPQSGRLPRFEPGQGADLLISAAGALHLTALPLDLLPTASPVTLSDVRTATEPVDFAGDPGLVVHRQAPPGSASLSRGRRDPRECWVMFGLGTDTKITVTHGAHAIRLVA